MGIFVVAYMRIEGGTGWLKILSIVMPYWLGAYFLFHAMLHLPWPQSLVGDWFPALRTALGGLV